MICATPHRSGEHGMALIGVILLLMTMTALCAALAVSGNTETLIARNHQSAAEARAAAEAGLNHALEVTVANLRNWQASGFASRSAAMSGLLDGPDNLSGTSATDADNGSLEALGIPGPPARLTLAGLPGFTYEARVFDEDDPARGVTLSAADLERIGENTLTATDANTRLVVRAIGYASGNAVATIEATLAPLTLPAIVTNGSLTISGNPTITGTEGSVHSNTNLTISGNPTISENATASGIYSTSGSPTIGGAFGGGYGNLAVPTVQACNYVSNADFVLNDDGTMTTVATATCIVNTDGTKSTVVTGTTASCNPCAGAWVYNSGNNEWVISGNAAPAVGIYYIEGRATISGNPGSAVTPAQISIIAEGSIEISGNPDLQPDSPDLLFVTDGDLKIGGNLGLPIALEGQMLVREQVSLGGNPTLAGQLLVEDAANVSTVVTANSISGNPTFVYNGIAGGSDFIVSAWRRVP